MSDTCHVFFRISVESLESQSTLRSDEHDHVDSASYHDIDDDSLLADFKMPDLSVNFNRVAIEMLFYASFV